MFFKLIESFIVFIKEYIEPYPPKRHQGTQTEILQITEPLENGHGKQNHREYYHTIERETIPSEDYQHNKLRKSASFSSSSGNSLGSNSLTSATSTLSLRSSPLRSSSRTLKSDKINAFQKWETTVESISYVTTKTIAVSEFPSDNPSKTIRSRSTTPNNNSRKSSLNTTNGFDTSIKTTTNGCNGPAETAV